MLKKIVSITIALLTAACVNQPKTVSLKPVIKNIAIISAVNPTLFSLENVSAAQFLIPLAATANYLDSKSKAKTFNEKLSAQLPRLGASLTDDMASALRGYGYQVEILEGVTGPPDDINNIDYAKVSTKADAVLHIWFTDVGLFSPRSSSNYLPRVNARGVLFVKGREDYLYEEEIYYGVDARNGNKWAIAADPKFAYPSFDAVLSNLDGVRQAFSTGSSEIAKRMVGQVHDSIK
jgi:hypothetical protein